MKTLSWIVLLTTIALAGCAASVAPISAPDGRRGFTISCNGSADSWAKCYRAATEACGGPYDVVDRNQSSTPTGLGPMVTRDLVVACKG